MSLVRVKIKSQVTIPDSILEELGVQVGDVFEASVEKGTIVLRPKALVVGDEYTPAQRRRIDLQLAKSTAEHKAGKLAGPFENHQEMVNLLHRQAEKTSPDKATRKRRTR